MEPYLKSAYHQFKWRVEWRDGAIPSVLLYCDERAVGDSEFTLKRVAPKKE